MTMSPQLRGLTLAILLGSSLFACRRAAVDAESPVSDGTAETADPAATGEQPIPDGTADPAPDGTTETDTASTVATVSGEVVITQEQLTERVTDIVERYERLPDREPTTARWRNQRRRRIVQEAVHDFIMNQHVSQQNIAIGDEEVGAYIAEDLEHVMEDERLFERFLQSRGVTREEYFESRRQEMIIDRVLSQRGSLEPSEEDVNTFYEQNAERWREGERVLASNITIRLREDADDARVEQAMTTLEDAVDRIEAGETFADVAREVSESADRIRGGDLGWVVRGRRQQLADDGVEEIIFDARPDTITDPIRTQLGLQIYWVRDHRDEGVRQLDEVEDIIYNPLVRRQRDQLRRDLVEELMEDIEVEYLEDNWGLEDESSDNAPSPTPTPTPPQDETSPE